MRAVFADPKSDFVLYRVFGTEAGKDQLIALLDAVLELDPAHRITEIEYLTPEQRRLSLTAFRLAIIGVRCRDASGHSFLLKMQVLNVEGFEKHLVDNSSNGYVEQLRRGEASQAPADIIGISICDFVVWPDSSVPLHSRWRMQEQNVDGLGQVQIQHAFLELPKYAAGTEPATPIDRWAFFFREAEYLETGPAPLSEDPFRAALEATRLVSFSQAEEDRYDRDKMARQDARGALSLAYREGYEQGLRLAVRDTCTRLEIPLSPEQEKGLAKLRLAELEALLERLAQDRRWPDDPLRLRQGKGAGGITPAGRPLP